MLISHRMSQEKEMSVVAAAMLCTRGDSFGYPAVLEA